MNLLKKILKIVLVTIFAGFILLAALIWWLGSIINGRDHVSDEDLIRNLQTDSKKYSQLISMFREDYPLKVVHPTWIDPKNSISDTRWSEYKVLFKDLELDAGMRGWVGDSILFISTAQGLVTGGSSKGYIYKPINHLPLYSSLSKAPKDLKSNVRAYRKINDTWYITYSWDD